MQGVKGASVKRTLGDLGPVLGRLASELVLLWKVTGSQHRFRSGQGMVGVPSRRETQLVLLTLLEQPGCVPAWHQPLPGPL